MWSVEERRAFFDGYDGGSPERTELWQRVDEYSDAWMGAVQNRWRRQVEAGQRLWPPAFTYPDGRALATDGRTFDGKTF